MHSYRLLLASLLVACFSSAMAQECSSYTGTASSIEKPAAAVIEKTLAAIKAKKVGALFAQSGKRVVLSRRLVSAGESGRTGNVRLALRPRDFDSQFNIQIVNQVFPDFSTTEAFDSINLETATVVRRDVCEDARNCDDNLPPSESLPFLLQDLLLCNPHSQGVFVLDDGIFVIGMHTTATTLPVGTALYFAKNASSYRLGGLIIDR